MDGMSRLQKEQMEVKKFLAEATNKRNNECNLEGIALFLDSLDNKLESIAKEEAELSDELAQLKSKKHQLKETLHAKDEEYKSLQIDVEFLKKENTSLTNQVATYEQKIKMCKNYHLSSSDKETLKKAIDKTNVFRRLTGIKFVGPADGDMIEGLVYNEKNKYLKQFKLKNDGCCTELWKMLKEASNEDWTDLEKEIKMELNQKRQNQNKENEKGKSNF